MSSTPLPRASTVALVFVAGAAVSCRSSSEATASPEPEAATAAVATAEPPPVLIGDDPLTYLLARYDADGDGAVARDEYSRQGNQFARWDLDGDGSITAADFEVETPELMGQIMYLRKARALGRHFQADDDHAVLHIDEFGEAFVAYDVDGDTELTREEFEALAEERRVGLPGDDSLMMQNYTGGGSAWATLRQAFDEDKNDRLAIYELGLFFEEQETDELRFDQDRCDDGKAGDTFERVDLARGAPEGSQAPDLTLPTLHGDEKVSLRDFAGDVPVALIFGSYT